MKELTEIMNIKKVRSGRHGLGQHLQVRGPEEEPAKQPKNILLYIQIKKVWKALLLPSR